MTLDELKAVLNILERQSERDYEYWTKNHQTCLWLDKAKDALSNAIERIEKLNNYAQHRIWCEAFDGDGSCDCGLDALLAEEQGKSLSDLKDEYFPNKEIEELRMKPDIGFLQEEQPDDAG